MFTYYSFRNICTYISEYYFQIHYMLIGKYSLVIFHSLFVVRNLRVGEVWDLSDKIHLILFYA